MNAHAQNTTSDTYGSNFTMMPASAIVTRVQVDTARAHTGAAPRALRPLYNYAHYDDAVAIYRHSTHGRDDADPWEPVGVILFAPLAGHADVLDIYALEVAEGCTRGDVERHIALLFGTDD